MRLYEINEALLKCVKLDEDTAVNTETGEVIDVEALDALIMEREEKVLNIARWIKDLAAEAEAVKAEKQKLEKRQKTANNKAESLKAYLEKIVGQGETIKDANTVVKWRKSTSTEVDLEKLLASDYKDKYVVFEAKANKTDIKAALKKGEDIPGCSLVEKRNVQIG